MPEGVILMESTWQIPVTRTRAPAGGSARERCYDASNAALLQHQHLPLRPEAAGERRGHRDQIVVMRTVQEIGSRSPQSRLAPVQAPVDRTRVLTRDAPKRWILGKPTASSPCPRSADGRMQLQTERRHHRDEDRAVRKGGDDRARDAHAMSALFNHSKASSLLAEMVGTSCTGGAPSVP